MKNIVIAAGYATRLYPLTENFPKPLLKIGNSTILDRMLADIDDIPDIDEHIIVTNHRFAPIFEEWKANAKYKKPITIIDDGTTDNDNRLGAVRDLLLAIETQNIDDDIMVLAADNILDFTMKGFVDYFKEKGTSAIMCHNEPELKKLQRTGVIAVDDNMKVLEMQEKPEKPVSNWAVPPFYIYAKQDLPLIRDCMRHGCGFDAPGNLAHYLTDVTSLHAWPMPGTRFDIGSMDSYLEAQSRFKGAGVSRQGMKILVTGAAGFIGSAVCRRLLDKGDTVVGLDNINDYYDPELKYGRLKELGIAKDDVAWYKFTQSSSYERFSFIRMNLEDTQAMQMLFANGNFDLVVNLGAQAGVRYSITNPHAYIESNIDGFINILEGCRHNKVKHLVYASSSSVYGLNGQVPFSEHHGIAHPVSLYAATKKSNELMAHAYSKLYDIPTTGLRFFTVYGPWGRPDMSPFLFIDAILHDRPIKVFNNGDMLRDFTYIDDIVEGIIRICDVIPEGNKDWDEENPDPATSPAPYRVYNIGNQQPTRLMDYIKCIENAIGREAKKNFLPMQQGDVYQTYADSSALGEATGFKPDTKLQDGIDRTVAWFKEYYNL